MEKKGTLVLKHFNIMFQIRYLFSHLLFYLSSCFRTYVPYFSCFTYVPYVM
jgi:hypothetical protein